MLVPGLSVIVAPVMDIHALPYMLPENPVDFVVISSQHAIPAALECGDVPVVCVGAATARKAEQSGLTVQGVYPAADDLVRGLADRAGQKALHLHGRHTRGNVAERLSSAGLETKDCVVYDQVARDWTSEERKKIFAQPCLVIPLYSPRSAKLLSGKLDAFEGELRLVAISDACRDAWSGPTAHSIIVAEHPDGESMKRAIASQLA